MIYIYFNCIKFPLLYYKDVINNHNVYEEINLFKYILFETIH